MKKTKIINNKKGFLCLLVVFAALTSLFASFSADSFVPAFAETQSTKIDETDPYTDLYANETFKNDFNSGKYAKATSYDTNNVEGIYPMYFTEWHYGHSDYGLYFYVWNKTQNNKFNLNYIDNRVSIMDNETGSYYMYRITLVKQTGDQFYKFKIIDNSLTIKKYLTEDGTRVYCLGQLHLKRNDRLNMIAYPFAKKYVYTGFSATDSLKMYEKDNEVLTVNPIGGTYRTQPSEEDIFIHNDLHYVYYNIPNSYLEKYGDVAEYHFSYHPIPLAPIAVLKGTDVADNTLSRISSINDSSLSENYYAKYKWLSQRRINSVNENNTQYGFVPTHTGFDNNFEKMIICYIQHVVDPFVSAYDNIARHMYKYGESLGWNTAKIEIDISQDEAVSVSDWDKILNSMMKYGFNSIPTTSALDDISSNAMDDYITLDNLEYWSLYNFSSSAKKTYPTFEQYFEAVKVDEHLRYDKEHYKLHTYSKDSKSLAVDGLVVEEGSNGWDKFKEGEVDIKPIEPITSSNIATDQEAWKLENDSNAISTFHDNYVHAKSHNETPYIFRFAPSVSTFLPIYYIGIGDPDNGFLGWNYMVNDRFERAGTYMGFGFGIYDLVSLDLTFESKETGKETVIPLAANPKNINISITHAESTSDKYVTNNGIDWLKIAKIALIIAGIILGLYVLYKFLEVFMGSSRRRRY